MVLRQGAAHPVVRVLPDARELPKMVELPNPIELPELPGVRRLPGLVTTAGQASRQARSRLHLNLPGGSRRALRSRRRWLLWRWMTRPTAGRHPMIRSPMPPKPTPHPVKPHQGAASGRERRRSRWRPNRPRLLRFRPPNRPRMRLRRAAGLGRRPKPQRKPIRPPGQVLMAMLRLLLPEPAIATRCGAILQQPRPSRPK